MKEISNRTQTPLNIVAHTLVLGGLVLTPLLVVPFFTNFMVTSKLLVMFVMALLLIGVFVWQTLERRTFEIPRSPLVVALVFFGLSALVSSIIATQYPVENFLGLGGAYISLAIIAVVGGLLIKGKSASDFQLAFNAMTIILALLTVSQVLGFGPSRLSNAVAPYLNLPNTGIFNVAGAPFIAAQIFGLSLLASAVAWLKTRKLDIMNLAVLGAAVVGLLVTIPSLLPGQEASPLLLPPGVSWTIAIDIMKEPRSALFGVGPENFSAAYTLLKPAWINGQIWWNSNFGQGFDVPLTLLATTGLFGFGTWLVLAIKLVRQTRAHLNEFPFLSTILLGSLLLQVLFPVNIVLLLIQAVALAFFIANVEPRKNYLVHLLKIDNADLLPFNFVQKKNSPLILALIPFVLAAVITGAGLYAVGRAYAASYAFFQSSVAMQEDDGVKVYELQQQATVLNPYVASYRSNYALTNLAIATSLANKTDATQQEQEQISALIQQAIREARAATVLRPVDYQTWQVLGQIYRNLIGSAEGADQWAVSAYAQAINVNPTDPLLRIELGGLFYGAQQYNEAISLFQQAAELKPDLPNSHYNLANSLKAAGQLELARTAYQRTLALLPADSQDYILANQELEELEKQIAEQGDEAGAATDTGAGVPTDATPTAQSQTIPSVINQNVNESDASVVGQPSTEELNTPSSDMPASETQSSETTPAASPTL